MIRQTIDRPLRIAQIAPPGIPCPPDGYGASQLVASNLTEELARRGHEVTLFAHPASVTRAALVSFPRVYDLEDADRRETVHTSLALDHAERFDIIHNHCIRPGPSLIRLARPASLTTLHYVRPILYAFPAAPYAAVSHAQARLLAPALNIVGVAPNGIDLDAFPVAREKSDYLLFLGRIDPKKGVHLAIEVARALDTRLLIAAAHPSNDNLAYFETQVRPALGGKIEYIGHVGTQEKIRLLGEARCVLMPHQWEEPFGLVAAEALASGTPVVAMRRGALPEIVPDGVAGYLVDGVAAMIEAVPRVGAIRPDDCRNAVEGRYSRAAMADAYLSIYRRLLARDAAAAPATRRPSAFAAAMFPPRRSTARSNGATHHR